MNLDDIQRASYLSHELGRVRSAIKENHYYREHPEAKLQIALTVADTHGNRTVPVRGSRILDALEAEVRDLEGELRALGVEPSQKPRSVFGRMP